MYIIYIYIYTNIIWYIHDAYKNSLVGIQCAHRVTVTGVRTVETENMSVVAIIYIAYKC